MASVETLKKTDNFDTFLQLGPIDKAKFDGYIVKIAKNSEKSLRDISKRSILNVFSNDDWYLVKASNTEELIELQKKYKVLSVHKNFQRRVLSSPDDPHFNSRNTFLSGQYDQWNLRNSGFTPLSDSNSAWNITTGSADTVIAVIDSGINLKHPDIVNKQGTTWGHSNIWINQEEIPTTLFPTIDTNSDNQVDNKELIQYFVANNLDVDANGTINYIDIISPGSPIINNNDDNSPPNGYKDDIFGVNLVTDPPTADIQDTLGHGTAVAGIIGAAVSNNNIGIAGICWSCKIMPIKVFNDLGNAYDSDIVEAIYYAVDNGARVINLSLGGEGYSQVLQDAIDYAWNNGVLVVAAAGNGNDDASNYYPSGCARALSIGSIDYNDNRSYFSNKGKRIDITSYGQIILTTLSDANLMMYTIFSGTSISTPHVSGLAGLIFSLHPTWTSKEVRYALIKGSLDLHTTGFDDETGFGKMRAKESLEYPNMPVDTTPPTASITGLSNTFHKSQINITGTAFDDDIYLYTVSFQSISSGEIIRQFAGRGSVNSGLLMSVDSTILPEDTYNIILRVEDFYGNVSTATANNVVIDRTPPSNFSIISPSHNFATKELRPSFQWSESTDTYPGLTYDIYLNNNPIFTNLTSNTFTPNTDIPEGVYEWFIRSKDAAGNFTDTSKFTLYLDVTPPESFNINVMINNNNAELKFTTTDTVSGINNYQISVNGNNFQNVSSPYTLNSLPDGTYNITIKAIDKAGNTRESSRTFTITYLCDRRRSKADFNCDNIVNISDLSILAANWNKNNPQSDANSDNVTNLSDLSILAANWQKTDL